MLLYWYDVFAYNRYEIVHSDHTAIHEHKYYVNIPVLMFCCIIRLVWYGSFSYHKNTWTHIHSRLFRVGVMLFNVVSMRWYILLLQKYMNAGLFKMLLCRCDVLWCDIFVFLRFHLSRIHEHKFAWNAAELRLSCLADRCLMVHSHVSTIHEHMYTRNGPMLIWFCLLWQVLDDSLPCFNITWTHV